MLRRRTDVESQKDTMPWTECAASPYSTETVWNAGLSGTGVANDGRTLTVGLDPHQGADQWFVYNYFKESIEIDRGRYPATSSLRTWMRRQGFRIASHKK